MVHRAAEASLDEATVRVLVEEQHGDLAGRPLVHLARGWDNDLWRLGDDLVVRLPRRAQAVPLVANEWRWVRELAARLPVPVPVRLGGPGAGFPWPWTITRWLEGRAGDVGGGSSPLADPTALARFLTALHVVAPVDAPRNPFRGGRLAARTPAFDTRLTELAPHVDADSLRRVWEDALAAPVWPGPDLWLHGDLHPANVLQAGGELVGVVDFGDVCAGDPATDLAAAWMLLDGEHVDGLRRELAHADPATWRRARGWAVYFGLTLLDIGLAGRRGHDRGRASYAVVGASTLVRATQV